MAKTIVGLYDDRSTARTVVTELEGIGFGDDHLRFASNEKGDRTNYDVDVKEGASPSALVRYGVDEDEARFYSEGVRRGGSLVIARVHDGDVDRAVDVMARHNPVRVDDRREAYLADYDETAQPYNDTEVEAHRNEHAEQAQARFQEVQENLKIGKREVVRGGVRVHKYVDTDVKEETLRLREEHVDVNRTDVNRELSADEADMAFKEDSVEMVERAEEAVVEKTARVTGEVAVGKDVNTRSETVGGEVRSTRVEVEQIAGERFESADADFRSHYDANYATTDMDYGDYQPAYRYGYAAADTYGDRDYASVENDLRTDYDQRYSNGRSTWDKMKDAVQHGFNSARAAV